MTKQSYFRVHRGPALSAKDIKSGIGASDSQVELVRTSIKRLGLSKSKTLGGKKAVGQKKATTAAKKASGAKKAVGAMSRYGI